MLRYFLTLAFVCVSSVASAAPVFYDNAGAFNAATSGFTLSTENFNSLAPGAVFPNRVTPWGNISTGENSTTIANQLFSGDGRSLQYSTTPPPATITFEFNSAINAFAFDVWDLSTLTPGTDFTLETFDGATSTGSQTFSLPLDFTGNQRFFGAVDMMGTFTSVAISNSLSGDFVEIDNLVFGNGDLQNQPVPEPASIAIWSALGIAGFVGARRRRKQA